jgi:hypothetical protein
VQPRDALKALRQPNAGKPLPILAEDLNLVNSGI